MAVFTAHLVGTEVFSSDPGAFALCDSGRFGERVGGRVVYLLCEALYLFERGKLRLVDFRGRDLSVVVVRRRFSRFDARFVERYAVFCDLRSSGFVVKTALKFGADFRVYDKKRGGHAKWLVSAVFESDRFSWRSFASLVRVSHSTKKRLLVGVVDGESHVSYFSCDWLRP